YYFYLVYCLVVDKRLFREIRETNFRPIDEHVSMSETNTFGRGVMHFHGRNERERNCIRV
ncbi:hypothetical protein Q604_UNBC17452G0001, partial [human gut metagenome]